jgi:hypothetical protein
MRFIRRVAPVVLLLASFVVAEPALAQEGGENAAPTPPPPVAPLPPQSTLVVPPTAPTAVLVAVPPTPSAAASDGGTPVKLTTLRLMREKGIITQAEYESALHDTADTNGSKGEESNTFVVGKWSATLYGFVEADYIFDTTESYSDLAGNAQVQTPTSYAGGHQRTQFSIRNSRFGFRFRAPEYHEIRASAQLEFDLLGDWANPTYTAATGQPSENQFFTSPALRVRHAFLKVETPVIDVLFGQTWHLFGWQTTYHPNSVQIQGLPGEIYARTPQLRFSKTVSSRDVTFDIAIAAMRPPQRDSAFPEGEGGIHLAFNKWAATQTMGATGTTVSPMSFALTGDVRKFGIPNYPDGGTVAAPVTKSTFEVPIVGGAIAADAFVPLIPATKAHMGDSLSLLGEFSFGYGDGDLFTGLSSGLGIPPLVPVPVGSPAGTVSTTPYNPQIDPGFVTIDGKGNMTLIGWQTLRAGLQYYLPGLDGRMWISANYANVTSPNAPSLVTTTAATATTKATTNATTIRDALNWFDVNIMGDLTPAVRLGVEYAYSADKYADGTTAPNHRVQGSAFYIF